MRITRESSLRDVAFCVCTALDSVGVTAVLTGGGAATIHAPGAIQSYDLDFILEVRGKGPLPARVLEELGFRRRGHDYLHRESRFQLEFPPGPLAIGSERISSWDTLREGAALLHLITATDSCRDRLASFYHFKDRSALEQACTVFSANAARVDLEVIELWSTREGHEERFREFLRRIGPR